MATLEEYSACHLAALEKQVAQLIEQLGQNSRNSHKPPSSDTPEERQKRKNREKRVRQARKRGGQAGHRGTSRELVPPDKVSKFVSGARIPFLRALSADAIDAG